MAKNVDYAKLKALSKQILECIGDDEEGENPSLPEQDNAYDDGGQTPNTQFLKTAESEEKVKASEGATSKSEPEKKKKDAAMAMFSQSLASKFGK